MNGAKAKEPKPIAVGLVEDNSDDIKYFEWLLKDSHLITINRFVIYRSGEACCENFTGGIDVLLMDYNLGRGMNGVETLRRVKVRYPKVSVIILTGEDYEPPQIIEALEAGATAYLRKKEDKSKVEQAIRDAAEGRWATYTHVIKDLIEHLKDEHRRRTRLPAGKVNRLTGEEATVLRKLASGKSNDEIAEEMGVSRDTIKRKHLPKLYEAFDLTTDDGEGIRARMLLVKKALKCGVLRVEDLES